MSLLHAEPMAPAMANEWQNGVSQWHERTYELTNDLPTSQLLVTYPNAREFPPVGIAVDRVTRTPAGDSR